MMGRIWPSLLMSIRRFSPNSSEWENNLTRLTLLLPVPTCSVLYSSIGDVVTYLNVRSMISLAGNELGVTSRADEGLIDARNTGDLCESGMPTSFSTAGRIADPSKILLNPSNANMVRIVNGDTSK